ncbi:MAG: hypothetical protein ACK559_40825, partial [bacterium]
VSAARDGRTHCGCEIARVYCNAGVERCQEPHLRMAKKKPGDDARLLSYHTLGCFEMLWKE